MSITNLYTIPSSQIYKKFKRSMVTKFAIMCSKAILQQYFNLVEFNVVINIVPYTKCQMLPSSIIKLITETGMIVWNQQYS